MGDEGKPEPPPVIFRRTTGRTDIDDGRTWTVGQRTDDDDGTDDRTDGQTEDDDCDDYDDDEIRRDTTGRTERVSDIYQKVYRWSTPRNRHAQTFPD